MQPITPDAPQRQRDPIKPLRVGAIAVVIMATVGAALTSQVTPIAAQTKTYNDFIDAVWKFESSIDPAKQDWYNDNWTKPIIESYPEVEYPGRVVRDPATGEPVQRHNLTVQQYFDTIGVGNLYDPADPNPDWEKIQASVINYLGFIGFQFQESDLHDLGYYDYETFTSNQISYPAHYVDVPVYHWKNDVTMFLDSDPDEVSEPMFVTDTVHFEDGHFTGKHDISSLEDFIDPNKQIYIIRDHFTNKYNRIVKGLESRGKDLADYLRTTVTWDGLTPPISHPPGGRSNSVMITLSGLLAGAHLRGAQGVIELLVDHQNPSDENGTYILQYVQDYAGYQTPFGQEPCAHPNSFPGSFGECQYATEPMAYTAATDYDELVLARVLR